MRLVGPDGSLSEPIAGLPEVDARSQGGLLDVTASPNFAQDRRVFWTYSKPMGGGLVATAAAQGVLSPDGTEMTEVADIFVQDPASPNPQHYGSRVLVAPDGAIFVTTGEHSEAPGRERAQDPQRHLGQGRAPGREGAQVWTAGPPQRPGARLRRGRPAWTIEHGPWAGDELNLIEQGANYGWPVVSYGLNYNGSPVGHGRAAGRGLRRARLLLGPRHRPGGMDFYDGALFPDWQGDL
jgi:glucose/arabinose dehydrogenase